MEYVIISFVDSLCSSHQFPLQSHTLQAMHPLRITCLSFLIPAAEALNIPFQDSITISPDPPISSPNLSFELLSPSNHSTLSSSWSNTSFPPTHPSSSLVSNTSALQALGLDPQEPIFWTKAPSGVVVGVQCNVRYGRRLDFQDCRDAYGYIARADQRVVRLAQRHTGLPHDVALPLRFLGSMYAQLARFPWHLYFCVRRFVLIISTIF